MSDLVQMPFDWQLEVSETHALLNEMSNSLRRAEDLAVKIGRKLRGFQNNLPHGQFLPFLDTEFGMSHATAYNFMSLAETEENEPDKFLIIRNFPLYLQYRLASASMGIVKQIESGEIPPTVKAVQEAKKEQKKAQEETEKALAKVESAQQELFKLQSESHNTIAQLSQQITNLQQQRDDRQQKVNDLQQQITTLSAPEKEIVEKEVVPVDYEEKQAKIEKLQKEKSKLIEQRDKLSKWAKELANDLNTLQEEKESEREKKIQEARILQSWRDVTNTFHKQVLKLLAQFPTPVDTQIFEAEDWERLAQAENTARRFLAECELLGNRSTSMVIEAR